MRDKLVSMVGSKEFFIGKVGVKGTKPGYTNGILGTVTSLIIKGVKDLGGNLISDHVWVKYSRQLSKANVQEDDVIKFRAYVKAYNRQKAPNFDRDYGLFFLSKVEVIKNL